MLPTVGGSSAKSISMSLVSFVADKVGMPFGSGASSLLCKRLSFLKCIPGRLNGPERRVRLCGDATRAPTQGPGFRECEHSSPLGPGILARKR